jgi:hypothetical protein
MVIIMEMLVYDRLSYALWFHCCSWILRSDIWRWMQCVNSCNMIYVFLYNLLRILHYSRQFYMPYSNLCPFFLIIWLVTVTEHPVAMFQSLLIQQTHQTVSGTWIWDLVWLSARYLRYLLCWDFSLSAGFNAVQQDMIHGLVFIAAATRHFLSQVKSMRVCLRHPMPSQHGCHFWGEFIFYLSLSRSVGKYSVVAAALWLVVHLCCLYIYIYMCVCVYVCIYICVCVCVYEEKAENFSVRQDKCLIFDGEYVNKWWMAVRVNVNYY